MKKRIGEFFIEKGLIRPDQLDSVLKYSQQSGLRFGEAAREMGLITTRDMVKLFGPNYAIDFFNLDTRYFPEVTKTLFTTEEMAKLGVLPLGFKTRYRFFRRSKVLNVGLLTPADKATAHAVEKMAKERLGKENSISGLKIYLILADQFIDVLGLVYGVPESTLAKLGAGNLNPTLAVFVDSSGGHAPG
ncbi:MAG: hypothetical protein AB7P04_11970 [Bacteriovoracia bacterium]